eukprot:4986172-Pleurochrysis_carterae.AAC.1
MIIITILWRTRRYTGTACRSRILYSTPRSAARPINRHLDMWDGNLAACVGPCAAVPTTGLGSTARLAHPAPWRTWC